MNTHIGSFDFLSMKRSDCSKRTLEKTMKRYQVKLCPHPLWSPQMQKRLISPLYCSNNNDKPPDVSPRPHKNTSHAYSDSDDTFLFIIFRCWRTKLCASNEIFYFVHLFECLTVQQLQLVIETFQWTLDWWFHIILVYNFLGLTFFLVWYWQ